MERLVRNSEKSLFLLATSARLLLVWMLVGIDASGIYTYEHGEIAENLLAGRGFSVRLLGTWGPTSQQAPLVPFMLAWCYWLLGIGTSAAILLFLAIQCAQGGLLAVGTRRLAARVGLDARFAMLAGLCSAFFPPLVYSASHVQVASTACLLLVWLMEAIMQLREEPRPRNAIKPAVLMALAVLTDPILVLSGVAATFCWIIFDRPATRIEIKKLMVAWLLLVMISLLLISPWLVRGYRVHGRTVFIKSTFGYAFWQGNNSLSVGTDKVMRESVELKLGMNSNSLTEFNNKLWDARHLAGCVDDIALTDIEKQELGELPELERSELLYQRALVELTQQPGRYLQLCLRRLRFFLWIDESNPKTASLLYQVPQKILMIAFGVSLIILPTQIRCRLLPGILAFVLTIIFHSLTITAPRFVLPWEPLMFVSIAGGLQRIVFQLMRLFNIRSNYPSFKSPSIRPADLQ